MPDNENRIRGTVVDFLKLQGISSLQVELWGRSARAKEPSAVAETNDEGKFELVVDQAALREQFGQPLPRFTLRVFSEGKEIGDFQDQYSLGLQGADLEVILGVDLLDVLKGVPWEQLSEPLLLPCTAEQQPIDYEANLIDNPLAMMTLGDMGIAVELGGFEDLEEERILIVPYQNSQLEGLDVKTIKLFKAESNFGGLKPLPLSSINQEGGFVWGKVRRPGIYVPVGLSKDKFVMAVVQGMAQKRKLLTDSQYFEKESIELTARTLEGLQKLDEDVFEEMRRQLTMAELGTSTEAPLPGEIRIGNDGIPEPFALPGGLDEKEFRERVSRLELVPGGLPEEALFFLPEVKETTERPWPMLPAMPQPLPLPMPDPDAPLPIPWPPDPPTPLPQPGPIPLPDDFFFELDVPQVIFPHPMLCWILGNNWYMYHRDISLSGTAICSDIKSTTASSLHQHYSRTLDGPIISIPSVVGGKIYVGTADSSDSSRKGTVYKYDLASGSKEAEFPLPKTHATRSGTLQGSNQGPDGIASSPAVVDGKVYVSALTGILYCLDANTLACLWYTDLRKPHASKKQPISHNVNANGWSSPLVVNGRVYVGFGEGETNTYSFVYCLNASNGVVNWIFCTNKYLNPFNAGSENQVNHLPPSLVPGTPPAPFVKAPNDPPHFGASPWSHCSYDPGLNRIYIGTGNSRPDGPLPEPRYSNGIISLDATTGAFKAYFQPPVLSNYRPGSNEDDIDVPAGPMLFTRGGQRFVGVGSKNGSFFTLNADTLAIITQRQMLPYQSDGSPFDDVDPIGGSSENRSGVMATAAVNYDQEKIYVPVGGYASTDSIDHNTTPFMRAVRWDNLNDAWPTSGMNPPKYNNVGATMYTKAGESGMASPATVNDVVIMGTTASGLYVYDAGSGLHLRTLRTSGTPTLSGTMGPAVYGNYIVAGYRDKTLRVYSL